MRLCGSVSQHGAEHMIMEHTPRQAGSGARSWSGEAYTRAQRLLACTPRQRLGAADTATLQGFR